MKNYVIFLLLLFGVVSGAAQSSVGFYLGGGWSHITGPLRSAVNQDYYSISPGFDFQYQIKERWYIYSGISFLSLGEESLNKDLRWGSEHNGQGDYIPNSELPHKISIHSFLFYLSTQLGVKYYFGGEKFRFFVQSHIDGNILVRDRVTRTYWLDNGEVSSSSSEIGALEHTKAIVLGTGLGFGIEMALSSEFSFQFIPELRVVFANIAGISQDYTLIPGARIGVLYKL